jgi:hypothetical protein
MPVAAQKKDPAEVEAKAAAAEAATTARDEAREQAKAQAQDDKARVEKLQKAGKSATDAAKAKWHEFKVEVWLTNFNRFEFGFWKKERNKGKSRQFTSDMDIFAEISENGQPTGVLGYRKEIWKDATGMDKRLVLKLFSETLNWRASMDMMVARSLQQTLGAHGVPVTSFAINTNDDDFLIYLERSAHKWPLMPESFSFFIMAEGEPRFYELRRKIINLGGDYTLFDQQGDAVGYVDGSMFTIGGRWHCGVRGDHADGRLMAVMKLFAGMVAFNREARRHVKALAHDVHSGHLKPSIQRQEVDLYQNPRRVR